jgi:hypothetical protein
VKRVFISGAVLLTAVCAPGSRATELGIDGTRFTLNGSPAFLFGISYYGALGAPDAVLYRDLAEMQERGFNWIRVWATWAAFENNVSAVEMDGSPREPYLKKLADLVAECDRRGMAIDVTLSRGNGVTGPARLPREAAHSRAVETIVRKLKPWRNWYLDLGNERNIKDQRYVSIDELKSLRETVRMLDPNRLVTASHAGDISPAELRDYLLKVRVDFLAPHRPRHSGSPGQTAKQTAEYLKAIKELGRIVPVHYQEPFRAGWGRGARWNPKAEDFLADLRGAKAAGAAGWCFHNGNEVKSPDGKPRRSFDLRDGPLFEHFEAEERKAVALLSKELATATSQKASPQAARGPLRVHPTNPRYFTDGTGKAVYLTGAHTWNNLVDMEKPGTPSPFDFDGYLGFLERHHHNFIRLWAWDSMTWDTRANGRLGKDFVHAVAPLPWTRTGPGNAADGKPKFDLTKFDDEYFQRLRSRVNAAGRRGIYVSVMLFEGWGLFHANRGRAAPAGWAWQMHPFHPANNVNQIDAGKPGEKLNGAVHSLTHPAVNKLQEAYIHRVVDTVNDLDNVLYEVINEGGEPKWDWWVVKTIQDYERTKPKQHPVGITGHGAERLASMLASPADWISPGRADGYADDPPAWEGKKVSLLDTDHIWGVGGNPAWVWKSFLRGHNPLFMDPYDGSVLGKPGDQQWEPIRRAMGHARRLAAQIDLSAVRPRDELVSTRYCLANPGLDYIVFVPQGREVTLDLSAADGVLQVEWLHATEAAAAPRSTIAGGSKRVFKSPVGADAVLHVFKDRH